MEIKKIRLVKYVLVTLLVAFAFASDIDRPKADTLTNYNNIEINEKEYETLFNLGFTEDEIYYMDEATFEANKNLDAKLLAKTVKYYKTVYPTYGNSYTVEVTKEEYESSKHLNELRGSSYDSYKTVVSTITANGSNSYRFKVSTTWSNMPGTRSYDIIGVGFADDLTISSTVYFYYRYADQNGNYTTSYTYANRKSTSTGGAAVYHLPTGQITSLGATLYYDVTKNSGTTISMCGDYAHATSTVSSSDVANYSISLAGIGLGAGLAGHYDALPCAMSYAS